jgi:hypothetical protein
MVRRPFTSLTGSSSLLGLTASPITLLADPADLSAFWLARGNPTDVTLWWTPSFLRNSWVLPAVYSGPLSDVSLRNTEAVESLAEEGDEVVSSPLPCGDHHYLYWLIWSLV